MWHALASISVPKCLEFLFFSLKGHFRHLYLYGRIAMEMEDTNTFLKLESIISRLMLSNELFLFSVFIPYISMEIKYVSDSFTSYSNSSLQRLFSMRTFVMHWQLYLLWINEILNFHQFQHQLFLIKMELFLHRICSLGIV